MPNTLKETRTLVPKQILDRARKFADNGLYEKALDLLNRNKMEFEIYDTFIKLNMPATASKERQYHFQKKGQA